MSLTPLQRGWTSASPQGKKFAPPLEPNSASKCFLELLLNEDSYEAHCQFRQFSVKYDGFECVLLEMKQVSHMTGNFGRLRSFSTIMLTGNKKVRGFLITKMAIILIAS